MHPSEIDTTGEELGDLLGGFTHISKERPGIYRVHAPHTVGFVKKSCKIPLKTPGPTIEEDVAFYSALIDQGVYHPDTHVSVRGNRPYIHMIMPVLACRKDHYDFTPWKDIASNIGLTIQLADVWNRMGTLRDKMYSIVKQYMPERFDLHIDTRKEFNYGIAMDAARRGQIYYMDMEVISLQLLTDMF